MKKIFISGSLLSGKQTLIYLLDGHSQTLCNPIHDQLIKSIKNIMETHGYPISQRKNDLQHKLRKIVTFRTGNKKYELLFSDYLRHLSASNISRIEHLAFLKIMPNYFSMKKLEYLPFSFDFENFIKKNKYDIFYNIHKEISNENLYDIHLRNFFLSWKDQKKIKNKTKLDKKIIITKLPNNLNYIKFLIKENYDALVIYVDRTVEGILKSRTLNTLQNKNIELSYFDKYFYYNLNSNFLDKIKKEKEKILILKRNFPNKIFITSLEKLIYERKKEMTKIMKFCNLNIDEICYYPTYCGKRLNKRNFKTINDDQFKISEKNLFYLKVRMGNLTKIEVFKNIKFIKELLLGILFNFRNKLFL